ncbi:MAG: hypothetical protein SFV52_05335 [Saprospiraceae bacterium]|nr:hypothetical protein [Saprospiraceae bacterium]
MIHFCTLFDQGFLGRGLLLLESLREHCPNFHLHILGLDDHVYDYFLTYPDPRVTPVRLAELERTAPELQQCKQNRSQVEYYFTLSPYFPQYILNQTPALELVCSIDADLYFFSDPTPLFSDFFRYSILITRHHFADGEESEKATGHFNVCFQAFRNDATGRACLEKWRSQCAAWCYNHFDEEHNRFADQKYLDSWPQDYAGKVKIIGDATTNLAPWNTNRYIITERQGKVFSDENPLVFFHFSGIRILNWHWIANSFHWYGTRPQKTLLKHVYGTYLTRLIQMETHLARIGSGRRHVRSSVTHLIELLSALIKNKAVFYRTKSGRLLYFNFGKIHLITQSIRRSAWLNLFP